MSLEYPICQGTNKRRYKITTADHGLFPTLGTVSPSGAGFWSVTFVPDESFVGSIAFVARAAGKEIRDDGFGFGSIAYYRVQVGGVASDRTLVTEPNSTGLIAEIPASGLCVALLVECTAGFAYLYAMPLEGESVAA